MTVRDCAKQSAAFAALYDAYTNRDKAAIAWKEQGGKVVGELGTDVPEEILVAADILPVRVSSDPNKELNYANTYLEQAYEPSVFSTFEKIVDGTYDAFMDHLACSHTSDFELRMWLYLREIRRSERQLRVPPVEWIDWLWVRRRMYQEENEKVVARFKDAVEKWTGRLISDDELKAAFKVCNEQHAALREVQALRRAEKPRVTGSEALVITGAGFFMDRAEHAKLVRQVAADAQSWPEVDGPRVFMTGTPQDSIDLYEAIEATGCVVVGEDHDWGDRSFAADCDCDIDPMLAIVNRYMLAPARTNRTLVADRVAALDADAEATKADGVVFYMHDRDVSASWDYPEQRKSLEAKGVKTAAFFRQQWPVSKNEDLPEKLAAFAEELKGERA